MSATMEQHRRVSLSRVDEACLTDWDSDSPHAINASIRAQDARFRAAMRAAHPEFAPPAALPPPVRQKRIRDVINVATVPPQRRATTAGSPRAATILAEVSSKHGFTVLDLESERRQRPLVLARQEAMWRMAHETPMSMPAIGRRLGNRDHTTVLYGVKRHQARIDAGEA